MPASRPLATTLRRRRASLHQQLLARNRDQKLLLSISRAIASIQGKAALLPVLNQQILPVLGHEVVGLFVLSADGQRHRDLMVEIENTAIDQRRNAGPGPEYSNAGTVIEHMMHGEPACYDLTAQQAAGLHHPRLPLLLAEGLRYAIAAPLRAGGQAIGLFVVLSTLPTAFSDAQLPLLSAIADLLAVAVGNVLANEELAGREREKSLQLAVTDALHTTDAWADRLLAVARVLQTYVPFTYAVLGIKHPSGISGIRRSSILRLVGPDEYQVLDKVSAARICGITQEAFSALLEPTILAADTGKPLLLTGSGFKAYCREHPFKALLSRVFGLAANLEVPVPLRGGGHLMMSFYNSQPEAYTSTHQALLNGLAGPFTNTVEKLLAFDEVQHLKQRLEDEKHYLEAELKSAYNFEQIVGTSAALQEIFERVRQVGPTDVTVLLTGETGTGKELFARAIHAASPRQGKVLVKVNCAALPAQLIESELFGHERGAFTGATERRIGKFELAQGSTLFLDEIGEMPLELQSRLLRVLQEKEFERLGGNKVIKVDVRIVAATNRILQDEVAAGRFRADLYYRLNAFPIRLPALRERPEDLPLLAQHYLRKLAQRFGRPAQRLAPGVLPALLAHAWPGNVRELEHVFEQAMVLNTGPELALAQSLGPARPPAVATLPAAQPWQEAERANILAALRATGGQVHGPAGAAALLHIHPNTLDSRMRKLGLQKTFALAAATGLGGTT